MLFVSSLQHQVKQLMMNTQFQTQYMQLLKLRYIDFVLFLLEKTLLHCNMIKTILVNRRTENDVISLLGK